MHRLGCRATAVYAIALVEPVLLVARERVGSAVYTTWVCVYTWGCIGAVNIMS
jgi:hypothetical protein